jgi:hypothetical protein
MDRNNREGSAWASLIAVVAVSCTMGVLYLPLVLR